MAEHEMRKKNICTHNILQCSTTPGHKMPLLGVHLTEGQPVDQAGHMSS